MRIIECMLHSDSRSMSGMRPMACVLLVLAALVLIGLRVPVLVESPHLYAEGGSHYSAAIGGGFWGGLFFVHPQAGYFNLVANFGGILASLLPLQQAPYGPTYLAWLVHGIPFLMLVMAGGPCLAAPLRRALIFASLLFLPTLGGVTWLNTVNAQLYLGIACLLILLDDEVGGTTKRWIQRAVLLFAGLSGVYAATLAPIFWWRARGARCREKSIQWMILGGALCVQIALAIGTQAAGLQSVRRGQALTLEALSDISTIHVGKALLGTHAVSIARDLAPFGPYLFGSIFLAFAVVGVLRLWRLSEGRRDARVLLAGALLIWTSVVVIASFGHRPIGRYAVLPSFCVALFLIASLDFKARQVRSTIVLALLLFGLSKGMRSYRYTPACVAQHPAHWRESVRLQHANPNRPLEICPQGWRIHDLGP